MVHSGDIGTVDEWMTTNRKSCVVDLERPLRAFFVAVFSNFSILKAQLLLVGKVLSTDVFT